MADFAGVWDNVKDFTVGAVTSPFKQIAQGGKLVGRELGNGISSNILGHQGVRATNWGNVAEGIGRIGVGAAQVAPFLGMPLKLGLATEGAAFIGQTGYDRQDGTQPASTVQSTTRRAPAFAIRSLPVPAPPPSTAPNNMGAEGFGINGAKRGPTQTTAASPMAPDPNMLPAETPEDLYAYRMARRNAERQFEAQRALVQMNNRRARQDFRRTRRDVNRQAQGGTQDLATALAYLGMDTAPALYDVSKDAINSGAQQAIGEARAQKAGVVADGRGVMARAKMLRDQQNTDAELLRARGRQAQVYRNFGGS
jgi:hypothetical protein